MHDHLYRARNFNKWKEVTTWQHVNHGVANFSVFNGKLCPRLSIIVCMMLEG